MISISSMDADAPRFLTLVRCVTANLIRISHPKDVFVTRIDEWFDHRWLGFAGKTLGSLGIRKLQRLTIPPFIPRRVITQEAYLQPAGSESYKLTFAPPLHRFQTSAENMNRYIDRVSTSGLFLWFSGATAKTGNGSLLVYTSTGERQNGWYATFRGSNDWQLHKVRGLSRVELLDLMEIKLERESPSPEHISTT